MRRLAQALNVSPMTLYTYVPGKAELLDVMLDAAYAQMPRADTAGQPWRQRLTAIAEANMALLATHPWVATVSTTRPTLGPGSMAKYEHELRAARPRSRRHRDRCRTHLPALLRAVLRTSRR